MSILPRFLRFRDAPAYCGMGRAIYNKEVRPYLTEIHIGTQGIAFDRLEVDAVLDEYKQRNGRPASKGGMKWDAKERRASLRETESGTSIRSSKDMGDFVNLVRQEKSRKQNGVRRSGGEIPPGEHRQPQNRGYSH